MKLSIFVPSHRTLSESQTSLDSVITYARSKSCQIVISDNSNDPNKERYIGRYDYENLLYKKGPEDEVENWWNAASSADGDYIACISDDDHIFHLPGDIPEISEGYIGFRPAVSLWTRSDGFRGFTNFSILEGSPLERITRYLKVNGGANSTLFSFWKREPFLKTWGLLRFHPSRLGYYDWSVVLSLLALGPLQSLKDTLLVYDLTNWIDASAAKASLERMFSRGGFERSDGRYVPLFLAIDTFILIMREDNGMESNVKKNVALFCLKSYLGSYKKLLETGRGDWHERDYTFARALEGEIKLQDLFKLLFDYLEEIKPGLASAYEAFWLRGVGSKWGSF